MHVSSTPLPPKAHKCPFHLHLRRGRRRPSFKQNKSICQIFSWIEKMGTSDLDLQWCPPLLLNPNSLPAIKGKNITKLLLRQKKNTSGRLWCNCYLLATSRTASTVLLTGRLLSGGPSLGLRQSNTTLPVGPVSHSVMPLCHPPSPLLLPQHKDGNTTPSFHQCHTKTWCNAENQSGKYFQAQLFTVKRE